MPENEGRILHAQAGEARERGDAAGSLGLNMRALIAYDRAGDSLGFTEAVADRAIVERNLAGKHDNSRRFLILAKYDTMASVAIARESGNPRALALPLFELAKAQESLGELSDAVKTYHESVASPLPESHDRDSVRANFKVHLATCEYKAGDKTALTRAEEALHALEAADENKYEKDVWVSGGYMRLADMLRTDDPAKAADSLQKAKVIIDANPDLEERRGQWARFADTFTSQ